MNEVRCMYCRKYCKHISSARKCDKCEMQFKSIAVKIKQKFSDELKKLAKA